ncbi:MULTISPECIES: ROK family protein [Pelosinus]|uniref:ROK family protein n=1 Tax=Pelosinus fermentans B4 TaxID=1149862 RepID=I9L9X9_9FIRM|nr:MULTISPECIES: ROK family protein [Pelosinus]EIW17111.1 ROK family protein [Pelosinus fermentans B4]EIW23090.1 ROK family protein [Pelosinus fermentans A11]OAM93868.1 Glucokinase [Pelosinus fermentans DSM 17108]SDQ92881.1 ROK family protein (putative glucokinase) [Pelosinus fermentans]
MENIIANSFKLGSSNDALTLNVIRRQGPISRVEISKMTGLTPPTVTNITTKLLELGLIAEDRIGESSGGRRPLLLKINSLLATVIIVYIRSEKMIGYVINPEFQCQLEDSRNIKGKKEDEILRMLLDIISDCRKRAVVPVLAVGVVVRGPVRRKDGIAVFVPNIGWRNTPLKGIIEEHIGLPAFIENDVKALSNGEYYYGSVKDAESMILLKVSHGIGGGIIFNGSLYRGVNDSAGEVGHTTIDVAGPICSCGNYGCLEALASENALVDAVAKAIKEGQSSIIYDMVKGELKDLAPEVIYKAADAGDELAIRMLGQVARYLGIGIANLVNTFNPEILIIGGGIVRGRQYIEDIVRQTVEDRSFESSSNVLEISFLTTTTENTLKGAADIVFAEITESIWLGQR